MTWASFRLPPPASAGSAWPPRRPGTAVAAVGTDHPVARARRRAAGWSRRRSRPPGPPADCRWPRRPGRSSRSARRRSPAGGASTLRRKPLDSRKSSGRSKRLPLAGEVFGQLPGDLVQTCRRQQDPRADGVRQRHQNEVVVLQVERHPDQPLLGARPAAATRPGCPSCGRRRPAVRRRRRRRPAIHEAGTAPAGSGRRAAPTDRRWSDRVDHDRTPFVPACGQDAAEGLDPVGGRPAGGIRCAADDLGHLPVREPGQVVVGDGLPLPGRAGRRRPPRSAVLPGNSDGGRGLRVGRRPGSATGLCFLVMSMALRWAMVTSQASMFAPSGSSGSRAGPPETSPTRRPVHRADRGRRDRPAARWRRAGSRCGRTVPWSHQVDAAGAGT